MMEQSMKVKVAISKTGATVHQRHLQIGQPGRPGGSQLPPAFGAPHVLRAAQRWLLEWAELTPAQKALLHDTPVRPPLLAAACIA